MLYIFMEMTSLDTKRRHIEKILPDTSPLCLPCFVIDYSYDNIVETDESGLYDYGNFGPVYICMDEC